MKFNIKLTWSKFMALVVTTGAFFLDYKMGTNTTFMFAMPFIVVLITGKQLINKNKPEVKDEK